MLHIVAPTGTNQQILGDLSDLSLLDRLLATSGMSALREFRTFETEQIRQFPQLNKAGVSLTTMQCHRLEDLLVSAHACCHYSS